MGSEGSPNRTHICKAFSKAHASQALKICARAGQEEPVRPGRRWERAWRGSGLPWPAARRVQTGPRQPNPAARARGRSQG